MRPCPCPPGQPLPGRPAVTGPCRPAACSARFPQFEREVSAAAAAAGRPGPLTPAAQRWGQQRPRRAGIPAAPVLGVSPALYAAMPLSAHRQPHACTRTHTYTHTPRHTPIHPDPRTSVQLHSAMGPSLRPSSSYSVPPVAGGCGRAGLAHTAQPRQCRCVGSDRCPARPGCWMVHVCVHGAQAHTATHETNSTHTRVPPTPPHRIVVAGSSPASRAHPQAHSL